MTESRVPTDHQAHAVTTAGTRALPRGLSGSRDDSECRREGPPGKMRDRSTAMAMRTKVDHFWHGGSSHAQKTIATDSSDKQPQGQLPHAQALRRWITTNVRRCPQHAAPVPRAERRRLDTRPSTRSTWRRRRSSGSREVYHVQKEQEERTHSW